MTGYCFPGLLVDLVALLGKGRRDETHDLFDAHLPLVRHEQQPGAGPAVRSGDGARNGPQRQTGRMEPADRCGPIADRPRRRSPWYGYGSPWYGYGEDAYGVTSTTPTPVF